jgi:RNA polymerase sigma-70 factor (ECF subfamily)
METDPRRADTAPGADADDALLLRRVADGDRRAFDALYRQYWPRLSRFLGRLTRRSGLVEEVLNDTMLVVWDKAGSFKAESRVSTWIFAIAYKKALKALKSWERPEAPPHAADGEATAPDDPVNEVMRLQLQGRLRRALATLSPEQRAVVELTYFHGYAYGEIGQIMRCPVDTVKTRMFHARRKLRLLMDAEGEEE